MEHLTKKRLTAIIDFFGEETQINKIQEEILELALILNQRKCPTKNPKEMEKQLYDELADVTIMLGQARILFDSDRIDSIIEEKLLKVEEKYLSRRQKED